MNEDYLDFGYKGEGYCWMCHSHFYFKELNQECPKCRSDEWTAKVENRGQIRSNLFQKIQNEIDTLQHRNNKPKLIRMDSVTYGFLKADYQTRFGFKKIEVANCFGLPIVIDKNIIGCRVEGELNPTPTNKKPLRRIGEFEIYFDYLRDILHLPEGTKILKVNELNCANGIQIVIEHPALPETPEGGLPTQLMPTFRKETAEAVKFIEWGIK